MQRLKAFFGSPSVETHFDANKNFKKLQPHLKQLKVKLDELKAAAEKKKLGSLDHAKNEVMKQLSAQINEKIAAYNSSLFSILETENLRKDAALCEDIKKLIIETYQKDWAIINENRVGAKKTAEDLARASVTPGSVVAGVAAAGAVASSGPIAAPVVGLVTLFAAHKAGNKMIDDSRMVDQTTASAHMLANFYVALDKVITGLRFSLHENKPNDEAFLATKFNDEKALEYFKKQTDSVVVDSQQKEEKKPVVEKSKRRDSDSELSDDWDSELDSDYDEESYEEESEQDSDNEESSGLFGKEYRGIRLR